MARANEIASLLTEEHSFAVVSYGLNKSNADKIEKLRGMFSADQLDPEEENLPPHITIFYGLKDHHLPIMQEDLRDFGELSFTIGAKPKIFDNPKHDVLVLPVESACFVRLHKHIRNLTGVEPPTYREYVPHCTIAFLKKGTPYDHVSLPSDIIGKTSAVSFSSTQDKLHPIRLT